jgi:hypothetical protein
MFGCVYPWPPRDHSKHLSGTCPNCGYCHACGKASLFHPAPNTTGTWGNDWINRPLEGLNDPPPSTTKDES